MTYSYTDISLTEFPGEISLILYSGSCLCECPWCFNPDLLQKKPLSFKQAKDAIDEHIDFVTALVISGGEPTLNPFLKRIIQYGKSKGLKIKLNTNGLVGEENQKNMFLPYLDYINVSLKGLWGGYKQVLKLSKVDSIILNSDILEYSFVYSPTLWSQHHLNLFHDMLNEKVLCDWRTIFNSKWRRPNIFTVSQIQVGNCLNKQYNFCRTPTKKECVDVAKIFQDIPKNHLIVETKEYGREYINDKKL